MKLILALLLATSVTIAESDPLTSPEQIEAQATLERTLARRYQDILQTVLEEESFTVGVLVVLKKDQSREAAPVNTDTEPEAPTVPPEMSLGLVERMEQAYISRMKPIATAQQKQASYKIQSVLVNLGLDSSFDQPTVALVEKWMKTRLALEFGERGSVGVSLLAKPSPKKTPKQNSALPPPRPPASSWPSKELAFFFGLAILALVALKFLLGRRGKRPLSAEIKGEVSLGSAPQREPAFTRSSEQTEVKESANPAGPNLQEELAHLSATIGQAVRAVRPSIEILLISWRYGKDRRGPEKLAFFLGLASREGEPFTLPEGNHENVSAAFRDMAVMPLAEQVQLAKEVYWEVAALQGLGPKSLEKPFSCLSKASLSQIESLLKNRNRAERALILLYCPSDIRAAYLDKGGPSTRKELLETALDIGDTSATRIGELDQEVKTEVAGLGASTEPIAMEPLLKGLMETFSPEEEQGLLRELRHLPNVREFLRTYPSFVYVDKWSDETLALLLREASPEEMVALLRLTPELAERALKLCPPLTAELVKEELARKDSRTGQQRHKAMESLKGRLLRLGEQIGSYLGQEEDGNSQGAQYKSAA